MRSSFLAIHSLVPGGNIHEYERAPIKTVAQKFLTHHASLHSASNCWSKLLFKCFHYFVLPVASAPGKGNSARTLDSLDCPEFGVKFDPITSVL